MSLSFQPQGNDDADVRRLLRFLRDGFAQALRTYEIAARNDSPQRGGDPATKKDAA